eukprot:2646896-Pleurochrysis_carterae.AAC.3
MAWQLQVFRAGLVSSVLPVQRKKTTSKHQTAGPRMLVSHVQLSRLCAPSELRCRPLLLTCAAHFCRRYLDISSVYDGSFLKGLRVLITGGNRGLGLATVKQMMSDGAEVVVVGRKSSPELDALKPAKIITGCDVTDADAVMKMATELEKPVDIVINNAGYFMEARLPKKYSARGVDDSCLRRSFREVLHFCSVFWPADVLQQAKEQVDSLNFEEQLKQVISLAGYFKMNALRRSDLPRAFPIHRCSGACAQRVLCCEASPNLQACCVLIVRCRSTSADLARSA